MAPMADGRSEITSDEALDRFGVLSATIAVVLTALLVWIIWGAPILIMVPVAVVTFGFSFGLSLAFLADPKEFIGQILMYWR